MRTILVSLATLLLISLTGCDSSTTLHDPSSADQPNIVILFADDLGYGDIGPFGHPTIDTPHLNRMAREGMKLTQFYAAASVCTPSRAALLTGRLSVRSGMNWVLFPDSKGGLPDEEVTVAEAVKEEGYTTAAFGKWHLGHLPEHLPTEHGFDRYYGVPYSNDMLTETNGERGVPLIRDKTIVEYPTDQRTLTRRYTEEAISFIEENEDNPFFLYLPYTFPHVPLYASEAFQDTSARGLYGDVVEEIDWSVGRILETIAEAGIEEETIIVFTSDNGPWSNMPDRMFSEDIVKPWDAGSAGPLRGSKATAWEGGFRVPFVARWTGHLPEGKVSADPASTLDLYTTLARLGGADVPSDRAVDGIDLLPFLQGEHDSPRSQFFYFMGERLEAVREGPWKYHVDRGELYHLDIDPGERFDVAERYPEVVAELTSLASQAPERDWVGR